jgi:hypothetical protein
MAHSLIDIENNKLILNSNISKKLLNYSDDKKIKVVSIIGKARTGKSTLLNILLSHWKLASQSVFTMSDSGKHCTNGIDIYNISEKGIILLDFQGIYLGDSSNDPKLLLLAYILSDIIIFNETKLLSNITLQQFEPMLSFINYMKGRNDLNDFNPKLIFRISDMTLDIDPTTNMRNMLNPEEDQFQAIRECIIDLFDSPYAVFTNNLDRSELKLMRQNKFKELLELPENGFNTAITKINEYLEFCESRKTISIFLEDLPKILKNINDEKAIDFKKLDIVKSLGDIQIRDWIDSLGTDIYSDIKVDGTTETYKNVEKRQDDLDKIIKDLDKTFKSIPKTIRVERISILKTKISEKIEKAIKENKAMAEKLMSDLMEKHLMKPNTNGFTSCFRFENLDVITEDFFDNFIQPFIDKLELINEYGKHIHNVALLPFCKWKLKIIEDIREIFHKEYKEVKDIIDGCKSIIEKKLIPEIKDCCISELVKTDDIMFPYDTILSKFQIEQNTKFTRITSIMDSESPNNTLTYKYNNVKIYSFHTIKVPDVYSGGCEMKIDNVSYVGSKGLAITYEYNSDFKKLYTTFTKQIKEILDTQGIEIIAKKRNIKLTELGYLPQINYDGIIKNNPKTQFISFTFDNIVIKQTGDTKWMAITSRKEYMTQDYYKKILEPILMRTCERLYEKGYLYNADEPELNGWLKFLKDITDIQVLSSDIKIFNMSFEFYRNIFKDNYKRLAMAEIFENRFKKELVK